MEKERGDASSLQPESALEREGMEEWEGERCGRISMEVVKWLTLQRHALRRHRFGRDLGKSFPLGWRKLGLRSVQGEGRDERVSYRRSIRAR